METLSGLPEITIAGTYSHFPVSDEPGNPFTETQIARFIEFSNRLSSMGIQGGLRHLANSGPSSTTLSPTSTW
jgi:alanine racemase